MPRGWKPGDGHLVPVTERPQPEGHFFIKELAEYLNHPYPALRNFLKKRGLIHKTGRGTGRKPLEWVTAYGVEQGVTWARQQQTEWSEANSRNWHVARASARRSQRARRARLDRA